MTSSYDSVLVVGAGCFGLSTAYHLLKKGLTDVIVIDRSSVLPAPDAASNDLNKVIRTSYDDEFYTNLAHEAIQLWKDEEEWGDSYHESGVLLMGSQAVGIYPEYVIDSYRNDVALGLRLDKLENGEAIRGIFPPQVPLGSLTNSVGYLNRDGGWADASQATLMMMSKVVALGGKIHSGKGAEQLIRTDGRTSGVKCTDGTIYCADVVVLAIGSWTASTFPELQLQEQCLATGQSIAMIQLNEEEAALYRQCPVVLDLSGSGFYIFPPNKNNTVKLAIHAAGYTHCPISGAQISTPRTVTSHAQDGLRIPKDVAHALRRHLRPLYPDLAQKPFCCTRLCWYTDSPNGDWVIGFHPSDSSLMLATGGSGHAYKFLPVIGRLVVDALHGTLDASLIKKFAVGRNHGCLDSLRPGNKAEELCAEKLCSHEDLLPPLFE